MKVLVVEDDKMPRRLMTRFLQTWGYDVFEAENGAKAWEYFQEEPAEIVISDWMMPEVDGVKLCGMIRSAEHLPHVRHIPYTYFLLVTSRSDKESLVEALAAGADDFISKPFDEEELKWRVRAGERLVGLSRDLSKELSRAEDFIKRVNLNLTQDIQRLVESLDRWKESPGSGNGQEKELRKVISQDVLSLVYDWIGSLDSVLDQPSD